MRQIQPRSDFRMGRTELGQSISRLELAHLVNRAGVGCSRLSIIFLGKFMLKQQAKHVWMVPSFELSTTQSKLGPFSKGLKFRVQAQSNVDAAWIGLGMARLMNTHRAHHWSHHLSLFTNSNISPTSKIGPTSSRWLRPFDCAFCPSGHVHFQVGAHRFFG